MLGSMDAGVVSVLVWRLGQRRQSLAVVSLVATACFSGQADPMPRCLGTGRGQAPGLGASPAPALAEAQHIRGSTWQASRGVSGGDGQAEYASVAE